MAMQKKAWMTSFLFKEFLSFSKRSILRRISLTNRHLLIVDGHSSHVITLEAIKQAHEFGLNMVTVPAHTFHALQPFDVSCLKPFKTTFRKEKDVAMSKSNYVELDKITIIWWVDQALDKSIMEQNIRFGFRVTCIYFLNPRAMDNKIEPSNIFTMVANEHEGEEKESNEQLEGDEPRIDYSIATNLHMHTTRVQIKVKEINIENISNTKGEDMAIN
jgi:hypothetical protein